MEEVIIGRWYRHFKGKDYEVTGIARDCEDPNRLYVVYRQRYGTDEFPIGTSWVRSLEDFVGFKEVDGKKVKRFTLIE